MTSFEFPGTAVGRGAGGHAAAGRVVTTLAGTGEPSSGGDSGPATLAALDRPRAVAYDRAGNVYVAEWKGHRVRRIAPDGTITTVAGTGTRGFGGDGGPAVEALLDEPGGLVLDEAGRLYIADYWNHRIRRVTPDGVISTVAGTGRPGHDGDGGPALLARFTEPRGLALDRAGNLYVAEWGGHRVRRIAPNGIITTVAGTGEPGRGADGVSATTSALSHPIDVAVDARGALYIADCWNHRIRKVSPNGIVCTIAGTGRPGYDGDDGLAHEVRLDQPRGVDLDAAGRLYIADSLNQRIIVVAPDDGRFTTLAGGPAPEHDEDGGPALGAELYFPRALTVTPDGGLVVAESDSHRVRRISAPVHASVVPAPEPVSIEPVAPATVPRDREFDLGARIRSRTGDAVTVELALPDGLVTAGDAAPGPVCRTFPAGSEEPGGALDGVFRIRAADGVPPGRYEATLTVRGPGPWQTSRALSVVITAPLPLADERALTVLQENVPQATPGGTAVVDIACIAPACQPVAPGRIVQRFTAPTGFVFEGRPVHRHPHGAVAKRVAHRMEDDGRTLVILANPHINTVATDQGGLVCTLPLRALADAAPGTYEDGLAEIGALAPVRLTAVVLPPDPGQCR
ncbi:NHL repeat-containing protein [Streptomyces sp. NPDC049577]|uniref:NHL repeat-containing protein n=1 Tax=Streptomyces sp. NPDC049577 TaxID=3155153 RepID=UPI00342233E4